MSNEQSVTPELYLVLGCFGQVDNGFVSCSGCENKILHINAQIIEYNKLIEYLDACHLFDKPVFDFNSIKNIIQFLYLNFFKTSVGHKLWSEKEINIYQKFIINHRLCGLYLKLELQKQAVSQPNFVEKTVTIVASPKLPKAPIPKLTTNQWRKRG